MTRQICYLANNASFKGDAKASIKSLVFYLALACTHSTSATLSIRASYRTTATQPFEAGAVVARHL